MDILLSSSIENEFNNCKDCADEFLYIKYLLSICSKHFEFEYEFINNLSYKFLDNDTKKINGIDKLKEYSSKLGNNITIPDSIEKLKQGYLIDHSFKTDDCIYNNFIPIIEIIYK